VGAWQIEQWMRKKDDNHFGKDIEFRESSFLANPRTPAAVKNSVLRVELCELGAAGCLLPAAAAVAPVGKQLRLVKGLTDVQARAVFGQYKTTKVGAGARCVVRSTLQGCGRRGGGYSDATVANRDVYPFWWEIAHAPVSRRPPISLPGL
jgi:hypothetical protein